MVGGVIVELWVCRSALGSRVGIGDSFAQSWQRQPLTMWSTIYRQILLRTESSATTTTGHCSLIRPSQILTRSLTICTARCSPSGTVSGGVVCLGVCS